MVDSFPRPDDPGKACNILWDNFSWTESCSSSTSAQRNLRLSSLAPKPKWRGKNHHMALCRASGLETSNWPLLKILSSPSFVNERVAFGLLYLPAFL